MLFESVLPLLLSGKKICRTGFNKEVPFNANYVYIEENDLRRRYLNSSNGAPSFLDYEDITATDWEEYVE